MTFARPIGSPPSVPPLISQPSECTWRGTTSTPITPSRRSAWRVRLVAERIGFEGDLGRKGRCGILRNAASRQTFLSDPEHPLGFLSHPDTLLGSTRSKSGSPARLNHSVGHIKIRPPPFDHEQYHYFCSAVLERFNIDRKHSRNSGRSYGEGRVLICPTEWFGHGFVEVVDEIADPAGQVALGLGVAATGELENQISIWLSQEACLGVKWNPRGCSGSPRNA